MNALSFASVCPTVLPALSIVHQDAAAGPVPGKVSGAWVFKGARVPVRLDRQPLRFTALGVCTVGAYLL